MATNLSFMVIDDAELDHFIAKKMIGHAGKSFGVYCFYEALSALDYVKSDDELLKTDTATLVLLDLYMPVMSGYEFLNAFEMLDQAVQNKYYIVALTSSHEPADMNRISIYSNVKAVIPKPLLAEDLTSVITRMMTDMNIRII